MAERIELPGRPTGTTEQQLENLYNYLYRMAQTMNINLSEIGDAGLTDDEQILMNQLTAIGTNSQTEQGVPAGYDYAGQQTLKSLVIKTAEFVKTALDAYKIVLFGETEAGGQYGDYRLKQGLRVDVNPEGIKQTYSFAEVVKGLKTYEINAKNYIKTGYLRTENSIPIYGVAIGKDVVTFSEDGTETYNDGNKVAELTADALSFFSNGVMLAKYAGTKTSFYSGGAEVMYIQGGKIYTADDMYIGSGKSVFIGDWTFDGSGACYRYTNEYNAASKLFLGSLRGNPSAFTGLNIGFVPLTTGIQLNSRYAITSSLIEESKINFIGSGSGISISPGEDNTNKYYMGASNYRWDHGHFKNLHYNTIDSSSSREIKHDIEDMPEMGGQLDQLRPVTYVYDDDPGEKKRYGLIYEETKGILPEICSGDEGQKALNYVELIPMLLKEIQSLRARVTELEGRE